MRSRCAALMTLLLVLGCSRSNDPPRGRAGDAGPRVRPVPAGPSASAPVAAAGDPHGDSGGRGEDVLPTSQGDLRILPIHHGSILFRFAGKAYYVDPHHEGIYDGLPPADVVFITHAHPDHLDPGMIDKLRKASTVVVGPPSVADKIQVDRPGDSTGLLVMKNGDTRTVAGIGVEAFPMYNVKRGPVPGKVFHEKGWGEGFVLTFGDKRVYVSGDTECTPEMRALKDIDVAFLCMNLPYTMTPREAAWCVDAFSPKILYPYHYRGSDVGELERDLAPDKRVEIRRRDWY